MSTGVGKHKMLSLGPTEPWSVREKLCLASSVMRSGDQNWVSVSRAIKPFSEPGRPPDWFSQKHCASQYSELLETTEAPKRKRGEKGEVVETIEDVIVRRLTAERIEELKRLLKDTQEKYRKLKKEVELIQAGHMDSKLDEVWGEIEQKRKQDEEEADQKKRATEAAYQVRQAAKNTPKRVPSVTVRSPLGASSPVLDPPSSDVSQSLTEEPCASPAAPAVAVFMPVEAVGPKESLGALVDDSPQKKLLAQKATPPPSPLLSELLKKGSLISASPRLVVEGEVAAALSNGSHGVEVLTTTCTMPQGQDITADAPTLSRLLETTPQSHHGNNADPPVNHSNNVVAPTQMDLPAPPTTVAVEEGPAPPSPQLQQPREGEMVEDLVAVSYMEEELDLATVGDIIAIIEEKVDESVEALDAAAVEAALSLCEEAGSHALPSPWEPQAFKPLESGPEPQPSPSAAAVVAPVPETSTPGPSGASEEGDQAMEVGVQVQRQIEGGLEVPTEVEDYNQQGAQGQERGADTGHVHGAVAVVANEGVAMEMKGEGEGEGGVEEGLTEEARAHSPIIKQEQEDWSQPESHAPCLDSEDSSASGKDSKELKEEDGGSEVDGDEAMLEKECGEGDGEGSYMSEVEPPASESEDGYGTHSQRYTTADSTASSPASSQFSMCSEDQEALQAQKIWKKSIMLVWRAAANHRYASVFLQPVSDDIAPGYHSIVHRPMDLSAIKKNIEMGVIRTTAEFQRDIMLMFQNAIMYNSSDHDVFHMALEMQRDVLEQVQQFLATQLIMQTSEASIGTKSLRGREGARKQDANEKDSIPMASPAFLLSLFDGGTRGRRSAIEADLKMKK
ncbi:bromodomain-containing protein 8 [Alosa alosa]|uniref:bromodomain-containing protein 8 n=1 Tax=Alosa alosa TaxID=278164 RepID=UPI0020152A38|nr:bromodomain-containing protein 8 [Alosa alosa]